jgi:hypothetical protein
MLGEHTAEVLSERLGHDQEQIRLLVQEGVIKVWPDQPEKAD